MPRSLAARCALSLVALLILPAPPYPTPHLPLTGVTPHARADARRVRARHVSTLKAQRPRWLCLADRPAPRQDHVSTVSTTRCVARATSGSSATGSVFCSFASRGRATALVGGNGRLVWAQLEALRSVTLTRGGAHFSRIVLGTCGGGVAHDMRCGHGH
jgi:hypothetical protein